MSEKPRGEPPPTRFAAAASKNRLATDAPSGNTMMWDDMYSMPNWSASDGTSTAAPSFLHAVLNIPARVFGLVSTPFLSMIENIDAASLSFLLDAEYSSFESPSVDFVLPSIIAIMETASPAQCIPRQRAASSVNIPSLVLFGTLFPAAAPAARMLSATESADLTPDAVVIPLSEETPKAPKRKKARMV